MAHVDIALTDCRVLSSGVSWGDTNIADTGLPAEIEADGARVNSLGVFNWESADALRFDIAVAGRFVGGTTLYFRFTVGTQSADSPPLTIPSAGDNRPTLTLGSQHDAYADWLPFVRAVIALFPTAQTDGTLRVQDGPFASGSITNKIATLSENDTYDFNAGSLDPADGTVTWQVKSGGGSITNAGVYTPPDVSANTAVTIALLVDGTEVDTDTFTVTPVFLPTISNKITTLAETATHDFEIANAAQATGTLGWRVKTGSVGTIDSDGVYSIGTDAIDVRTDTPVTVELIDTSGSTVTVRDSDTFVVTPVFTGTISNKIATLEETDTHDFDATGVSGPGDPVTWRVNSGGGTITNAGLYKPPDVTANRAVTVALLVGGRQVDTDTFTVNVVHTPVQSTQYAYVAAASAPALPAPQGQRSAAGAPSGWSLNDQAATTALDVYRVSRTITRLNGVFQSGDTDWAWDPATQPGTPYRLRLPTTRTEYAYLRGTSQPTLPTSTAEPIPAGWTTAQLAATTDAHVYRIRRSVNERQGAFVSASSWVFDPATQPWRQARTTTDTQYAFRRAETLDEVTGLPASTGAALPAGWSALAPARTEDAGNWRIARTRTLRLGAFVSATAWAWNPVYAQQPWQRALAGLSDTVRKWVTTVRHIASGALAQVVWTVQAEAIFDGGVDGYGIEEAYALFPASVLAADGTLTIPENQQPLDTWTYDQLLQAAVTRNGITWTDGPTAPTADRPVRVKALRSVPGQPAVGAAPTDRWSAWAWYVDVLRPEDGRYPAKELDVYLVVNAPATGGTTAATPTATSYRFADDVLVGLTQSWVRTRPLAVAPGQLVYCATTSAQDPGSGVDASLTFSAPVVCNDVLDIDIVYRRYPSATTTVARPANTAHNAIADGWYARPGLIPSSQAGVLWECVRYLRVSGNNVRWEYDDPYRVEGLDGASAGLLRLYQVTPGMKIPNPPARPSAAVYSDPFTLDSGDAGWLMAKPRYDFRRQTCWVIDAAYAGAGVAMDQASWSIPVSDYQGKDRNQQFARSTVVPAIPPDRDAGEDLV